MFHLVMYRPQMPENAGNIIRLSANCGAPLHFIGPLDFFLDNKRMLRAGLDYHEIANLKVHTSFERFMEEEKPSRLIASTTRGSVIHTEFKFQDGDYIMFGRETSGLPDEVMNLISPELRITIPMVPQSRCLNLANSAAVVAYTAWQQLGYPGAKHLIAAQ
ncbi:MAG: tRNA (cytidine(34)-2'-O)-methyltransferase [Proteobacteria bacterium]|uniref:tRNA (cytidine(34)-2'-O)-methyltransferase n=1 Tax=Candidatus Avisuccinivibrio stercorigallinarum TaxID=2840704 RepID=A0A9D9GSJ0_9GAMM|nr:tRNA (cytidine(34)-2'-O)-methyltransferase [Candidatus Avisuccinivibrio stercorigallinarum]